MNRHHGSLRVIDALTSGGGRSVNEDYVGWNGQSCWVLDGATPVTPSRLSTSDARWLVEQVDELLRSHSIQDLLKDSVEGAVRQIADEVDSRLIEIGFPDDVLPPACSLGLVSAKNDSAELAIVGDVTIYVPRERLLLSDGRFGQNESRSRKLHLNATLASTAVRGDIAERRRTYVDGPGDMYVLSRNARAGAGVHKERVQLRGQPLEVLIMSDGFARLVETYGVFEDYSALTDHVRANSLNSTLKLLRDHEAIHSSDSNFKQADDATAAHLIVHPN